VKMKCSICEGAGWDWKKAADQDLQVDDPVEYYQCETCHGTGKVEEVNEEQKKAEEIYPHHHPETALANYKAGHEVWDSNGDLW
jgi:RecJ-like exonuclease